jgi:hypothetical protein
MISFNKKIYLKIYQKNILLLFSCQYIKIIVLIKNINLIFFQTKIYLRLSSFQKTNKLLTIISFIIFLMSFIASFSVIIVYFLKFFFHGFKNKKQKKVKTHP